MHPFLDLFLRNQRPLHAFLLKVDQPAFARIPSLPLLCRPSILVCGYDDRQSERQHHRRRRGEYSRDLAQKGLAPELMQRREEDVPDVRKGGPRSRSARGRNERLGFGVGLRNRRRGGARDYGKGTAFARFLRLFADRRGENCGWRTLVQRYAERSVPWVLLQVATLSMWCSRRCAGP